jgi:hypothetical protein
MIGDIQCFFKIMKIKCHHCEKEIEFELGRPGYIQEFIDRTGLYPIPKTLTSSQIQAEYCLDCIKNIVFYYEHFIK